MIIRLERSSNKINIFLEEELFRQLPAAIFAKALSKLVNCNSKELFLTQFSEIEKRVGLSVAYAILARKACFSKELISALEKRGISRAVASQITQSCIEKGYINEEQLVQRFAQLKSSYGADYLIFQLRNKVALSKAQLRALIAVGGEQEAIVALIEKKYRKLLDGDPKSSSKLFAALARRGFASEEISAAIKKCKKDLLEII